MKIAMIIPDNRDEMRRHDLPQPVWGPSPDLVLAGFEGRTDVTVDILSCTKRPLASPMALASNLTYHAVHVPQWGWLRSGYVGCVLALRRKFRELNPDLVHGSGTERYAALAAAFSGFPSLVTVHGNMRRLARLYGAWPFSYLGLSGFLEGVAARRVNGVICLSPYARANMAGLARRTWVIPNAIDPALLGLRRAPASPPLLVLPASICYHKNQNGFIRALDLVARRRPVRLICVGNLPDARRNAYAREFKALVADRPWCEYGGMVDRQGMQVLLSQAWAVALPSREDNCPHALLEAMAAGVPVLASARGGIPDLVEHAATGLLMDPEDLADMARTVENLMDSPGLAARLAAQALERVKKYVPRAIAEKHLAVYREILATGVAA